MLANAFNKRQYCWFVNVQCGAETLEEFNLPGHPSPLSYPYDRSLSCTDMHAYCSTAMLWKCNVASVSCPPLPPPQGETSYIELLALTTAVAAARTIGLTGHLNIRHRPGGRGEYAN